MKNLSILNHIFLIFVILLLSGCAGAGSRKPNHPFFNIKDTRIETIQNQVKQVMMEVKEIQSKLNPFIENIRNIYLGLITIFSILISIFQGIQEKSGMKVEIRNAIIIFGIISALLSGTIIYLDNTITSQKELATAVNAYQNCIDTFFVTVDDIMTKKGNFNNPNDFAVLLKKYDEFNLQIIEVNTVFKDNILIQQIGLK